MMKLIATLLWLSLDDSGAPIMQLLNAQQGYLKHFRRQCYAEGSKQDVAGFSLCAAASRLGWGLAAQDEMMRHLQALDEQR